MKKDIHPQYEETKITCMCGNSWKTRSTRKELKIEHCSMCHPIYTGAHDVLVDTTGQVDKFKKRMAAAQAFQASKTAKKKDETPEETESEDQKEDKK